VLTTRAQLAERLDDFMATLLHGAPGAAVVVGHSLFVQAWMRRFGSSGWEAQQPQLVDALCNRKLANAACVGVRLHYTPNRAEAVGAQMQYGSSYAGGTLA
jgi:hypothetical protein